MQRKIIKQGKESYTVYLPKKWVDNNNLKVGDDVEIVPSDYELLIHPTKIKSKERSINLKITDTKPSLVRTMIVNAYRAGFDKIKLNFSGKAKQINDTVNLYMIGFEAFHVKDNNYSLESVSEPNYDNFDNIILKQFFLLEEMLKDLTSQDLSEYSHKVVKYDSFLRRCLSKGVFPH